jgi:glycosyltransferase involved in cell wall biosynthesis
MKIAVADNNRGKFTTDLIEQWRKDGHHVEYEMGFNEALLDSSDVYFVDSCDNNAKVATQNFAEMSRRNKLYIRLLDIETWVGHPGSVNWSVVDGLIFINEKIKDYTIHTYHLGTVNHSVVHCGIKLDRFPLKKEFKRNYNLAVVLGTGRIYNDKRADDAIRS